MENFGVITSDNGQPRQIQFGLTLYSEFAVESRYPKLPSCHVRAPFLTWAGLSARILTSARTPSDREGISIKPAHFETDLRCTDLLAEDQIQSVVEAALQRTEVIDMHTHLYSSAFGKISLWGIDDLLTYHYLEAEFFRYSEMTPERYWSLSKRDQADAIWQTLFVENTPISEATRGIVAVLKAFDLPTDGANLTAAREFFSRQVLEEHIGKVFELAGVSSVVMTNDPLDADEMQLWMEGVKSDSRFQPVLRLDRILRDWSNPWQRLLSQGYKVDDHGSATSIKEIRRFLADWYERMRPVYMAVSLPDSFQFPEDTVYGRVFEEAVLPSCREFDLPLSLMIGVRRQVNPRIRLAGDALGRADLRSLETLCRDFPENRFLVSVLSRENQHELCVQARKFNNLMPFGCWWFLNNPSIVEEITRERIEMLGTSFIPQHSDARVLEQLIYKWRNTRRTLAPILAESYRLACQDGCSISRQEIERDLERLLRTNFEHWSRRRGPSSAGN
jgi:hypothetical protein